MVTNAELVSKMEEMSKSYGARIDFLEAQMKSLMESINVMLQLHKFDREKGEFSTVSKTMTKEPQLTETVNASDTNWEAIP